MQSEKPSIWHHVIDGNTIFFFNKPLHLTLLLPFRTPLINAQCRSIPINADQNPGIDPNSDQCRSMPIKADTYV